MASWNSNMFGRGEPARRPPPFRARPPHGPPFRLRGPCSGPPPGHLPPGPRGPYSAADGHYLHGGPPSGPFISPHCSSFSIDHSTVIALGGSQQIIPPAEPQHPLPQWNHPPVERHPPDNSDQAGEEFLRCIAANEPLPDYLKGNMAYNLAEAFTSASILKEAVKSDHEFQKHVARSKSCSRSRARSHSRNWDRSPDRSRAKSCVRSKSRARSRSRGRSKSRARGKSRGRSKSRARSRSRSRSRSDKKSHIRSKSRARRSKSRSSSSEKSRGKKRKRSPELSGVSSSNYLLEGLKLVMSSQALEDRLPSLKDAILTVKASGEGTKVESHEPSPKKHDSLDNLSSLESDSMLLPHERRVGTDFSWLQGKSQEDSSDQKANEPEDEESFLYGNDLSSHMNENAKSNQSSLSASFGNLLEPKQSPQMASSALIHSSLDSMECEKIKTILKSLGTSDEFKGKLQGQNEEKELSAAPLSSDKTAANLALPALRNPNVRLALESLQSLIKATKEKRPKSDGTFQAFDKHQGGGSEDRKREKQDIISKMETLAKELDELLKQDGMTFMTPVIGFYCQKCEEFIGDLNSAENHAAVKHHSNSSQKDQADKPAKDGKGHPHHCSTSDKQHSKPSGKTDHGDYDHHRNSEDSRSSRDYQRNRTDERDHGSRHHQDSNHKSHREENLSLKQETRKERMLITVSRGRTPPPPNITVKEEANKEQAIRSHGKNKVEGTESKEKSSRKSREKDKSSDSSDNEEKSPKTSKKKKKKKDKKKKKKKKEKGDKS